MGGPKLDVETGGGGTATFMLGKVEELALDVDVAKGGLASPEGIAALELEPLPVSTTTGSWGAS